ncbi:hypothetical protein [Thalassobacillus devorans]|uniref:hypothetical protein n=1 Tax=Thalassobacillus devorans TaxID=279813 RepID=UPI001E536C8D|nr:hypothetical protein [Thalassobacillus devorans]
MLALMFLTVTSASIHLYQNHQYNTDLHVKKIVIDTLFQSGLEKFGHEMKQHQEPPENGETTYFFPDGEVIITYVRIEERTYFLQLSILTKDGTRKNLNRRYETKI